MGRLTIKIWILGIALALAIPAMIAGSGSTKLFIFLLVLGIFYVANTVKSKPGAIILIILLTGTAGFLILNSSISGVKVVSIDSNSSIFGAGLREGEIIIGINQQEVNTLDDYSRIMGEIFSTPGDKRIDLTTEANDFTVLLSEPPKIIVSKIERTNIQTGLDLRGGARAIVQADQPLTDEELDELISVSRNRFNVFGLTDVNLRAVTDLSGNKFMLIEIAGATPDDLESLVGQQGKFEAKIGNKTVFTGGEDDISDVCRNDAVCAGIRSCLPNSVNGAQGYVCNFDFTIYLTQQAAERHAQVTEDIPLDGTGQYLTERLFLYVDDEEVDSLLVGAGLRGLVTTQIQISGSEIGTTQEESIELTRTEMNRLQTILITGSLPYKLEIVKLDTISPILGDQFIRSILIAGASAIILVSVIVFFRYKKYKASVAMLLTAFSELVIILGIASFINWNLDLPSIAGILATIGTGIDQQIVILDEAGKGMHLGIKKRMKRAFFVIITAYATTFVALIPLWWAGAGLFRGFAFTTIIGITAGVLITRPAFADMIKKMER